MIDRIGSFLTGCASVYCGVMVQFSHLGLAGHIIFGIGFGFAAIMCFKNTYD